MSRDSLANSEKRNLNLSLDSKFHESKDVNCFTNNFISRTSAVADTQ